MKLKLLTIAHSKEPEPGPVTNGALFPTTRYTYKLEGTGVRYRAKRTENGDVVLWTVFKSYRRQGDRAGVVISGWEVLGGVTGFVGGSYDNPLVAIESVLDKQH